MARNEAPAAAMRGLHGKALGGASIGPVETTDLLLHPTRPASLLWKSISDESQRASAMLAALQHSSCVPQCFF